MNVRVLLVLATVLIAGVVAPLKKRKLPTAETSKRKKAKAIVDPTASAGAGAGAGGRIELFRPSLKQRRFNMVSFYAKDEHGNWIVRDCTNIPMTNFGPYSHLSITERSHLSAEKSPLRGRTLNMLTLDPKWVRFRHLQGTTGLHDAERSCSPYAGHNEKLFTLKNDKREGSSKNNAMESARSCTQEQNGQESRKMLKWDEHNGRRLVRNHHAAHVEIQIATLYGWATVPGAWVFPTSAEANQVDRLARLASQDHGVWHNLRKDLIGENSVTAIQLPYVQYPWGSPTSQPYRKAQAELYGRGNRPPSDYPYYWDGPSHRGAAAGKIDVARLPLWQLFVDVDDEKTLTVMHWSYLAEINGKIQQLVDKGELEFEEYGVCQFIIFPKPVSQVAGSVKNLISAIQPAFFWTRHHQGDPRFTKATMWYRRKNGAKGACIKVNIGGGSCSKTQPTEHEVAPHTPQASRSEVCDG